MNGVSRPINARRVLVVGSLALVAVVSFALTLALLGGKENRSTAEKPSGAQEPSASSEPPLAGGFAASGPGFHSLDQMVATSDLIATGTVTDVRPGEVFEGSADLPGPKESYPDPRESPEPDEGPAPPSPPEEPADDTVEEYVERNLNTAVRIEEVLKGPAPAGGVVTVKTLEAAYGPPTEWRKPGVRVLLFLSRSTETPELYITRSSSQSVYVFRDNGLVAAGSDPSDLVSERVASLSLPQLRLEVEQAKVRIASGEVKPLELPAADPIPEQTIAGSS